MAKNRMTDGVEEEHIPDDFKVPTPKDEETATLIDLVRSLNDTSGINLETRQNLAESLALYLQAKSDVIREEQATESSAANAAHQAAQAHGVRASADVSGGGKQGGSGHGSHGNYQQRSTFPQGYGGKGGGDKGGYHRSSSGKHQQHGGGGGKHNYSGHAQEQHHYAQQHGKYGLDPHGHGHGAGGKYGHAGGDGGKYGQARTGDKNSMSSGSGWGGPGVEYGSGKAAAVPWWAQNSKGAVPLNGKGTQVAGIDYSKGGGGWGGPGPAGPGGYGQDYHGGGKPGAGPGPKGGWGGDWGADPYKGGKPGGNKGY